MPTKHPKPLMDFMGEIKDPRRPSNGTLHDFREILVIAILAVLSDCNTVEHIADWAKNHKDWLRQFLRLDRGVPSQDTFLRILRAIDPRQFEKVFRRWVWGAAPELSGTVAIDGKTVRGSGSAGEMAIHMVSAFTTRFGLVLGQEKVAEKSNEITAIPELLKALDLKGLLVSIDAMGCQKTIARLIMDQKADYLLAVKNNQPALFAAIEEAFIGCAALPVSDRYRHAKKAHGRIIGQTTTVLSAKDIIDTAQWAECKTIGRIDTLRYTNGKSSELEQRYYISSRVLTAEQLAAHARSHWGIENQLHWVLDVIFAEDASTVRTDNAPENFSLLRKIALNLLQLHRGDDKAKSNLKLLRKRIAWNPDLCAEIFGLQPL